MNASIDPSLWNTFWFCGSKEPEEEITRPSCNGRISKETYGTIVYQNKLCLSQKLANFSKGDADILVKQWVKHFYLLNKLTTVH